MMEVLMVASFFAFNGAEMTPMGNTSKNFEDLDECLYQLVELQTHNTVDYFVVAGCIPLTESQGQP